jgi:hypothetical protein
MDGLEQRERLVEGSVVCAAQSIAKLASKSLAMSCTSLRIVVHQFEYGKTRKL